MNKAFTSFTNGTEILVGDVVTVHGQPCQVTKIRPFGTIDVVNGMGQSYRVSGLATVTFTK